MWAERSAGTKLFREQGLHNRSMVYKKPVSLQGPETIHPIDFPGGQKILKVRAVRGIFPGV
jgi:hypothetical protein